MKIVTVLPILVPLFSAVLQLALLHASQKTRALLNIVSTFALFLATAWLFGEIASTGIQVIRIGNWPAPSGIVFVADMLAASLALAAAFVAFCVSIYCLADIPEASGKLGYFIAYQLLLAGVCGSFLTGDLFNLFVWFEVMLVSSFTLVAFEGKKLQLAGALKYTTLNLISSVFFLAAAGILFAKTGTLNLADLSRRLAGRNEHDFALIASLMLLLISFGIKAGAFPLFNWMPASYHTPAFATSALFAGLLTKVGVYAVIRTLTLIHPLEEGAGQFLMKFIAGATMLIGVLGAAAQYEMRRLLSFHSVSQIGYIMMGIALSTRAAIAAATLFIVHHMLVKSNLFLMSGLVTRLRGTAQLKLTGGILESSWLVALLFLLPALSLAGVPPFSGFIAKLTIVRAALMAESYELVTVALIVGFFTLFSMLKVWNEAFWKPVPAERSEYFSQPLSAALIVPSVLMVVAMISMGIWPGPWVDLVSKIAIEITQPEIYITAVLGGI